MTALSELLRTKKLAIWDFDGTIADSEAHHLQSYQDVFDQYGIRKIDRDYYFMEIASAGGGAEKLALDYSFEPGGEKLKELKRERYNHYISSGAIRVFPEIEEILSFQRKMGVMVIIASNTFEEMNRGILKQNNIDPDIIDQYFAPGRDIPRKPNPDMFLKALSETGYTAEQSVVFEDTIIGVAASVAANIDTMYIRAHHNQNHDLPQGGVETARTDLLKVYEAISS